MTLVPKVTEINSDDSRGQKSHIKVSPGCAPSKGSEGQPVFAFSSCQGCRGYVACGSTALISNPLFRCPLLTCVPCAVTLRSLGKASWCHLDTLSLITSNSICKDPSLK
jgi:hypothetical protein